MTGKDLLENLSFIEERFVEEAEKKAAVGTQEPRKGAVRRFPVKKVLIAAVIALMLTLVGCAVAYIMHMKDFQVGEQEATKPVFENYGLEFQGYVPIKEQVLTLSGLEGSPGFQAAKEWYEFKQNYDPDHRIIVELMQEEKVPEFPAEYNAYNIYTQEMKDKLDEILKTYDLKPVGELLNFRTERNLLNALGVEAVSEQNSVTMKLHWGGCYENGNFYLNTDFEFPADAESDVDMTSGVLWWNRHDCFSEDLVVIEETGDWKEWNYTLTSGRTALILRSPSDWRGWIICDRGDATSYLRIDARRDVFDNDGVKDYIRYDYLSDKQLENIAEAIDKMEPRLVTKKDVENQPKASYAATQNGYTVEMKGIETDGYIAYITLGITAPEETIINHSTRMGQEGKPFEIYAKQFDLVTLDSRKMDPRSYDWIPQEDGDGKDNTQNFVIRVNTSVLDGSAPFVPGSQWEVRIVDLENWYLADEMHSESETLAEGEWSFTITIEETDGDYREIEMISQPITAKAFVGSTLDGKNVTEDCEITSLILRKFSADIISERKSANFTWIDYGTRALIMRKDGSSVELAMSINYSHDPIDLDQVDCVILADGTKIPMPDLPEE